MLEWAALTPVVVALGWALVRRMRRARRVLPRARMRFQFSLRTPETEPPPIPRVERRRGELVELDDNAPPLELDDHSGDVREVLSERPTDRPTPKLRRPRDGKR